MRAPLAGPKANGFPTQMWTLTRVADVIEKATGIRYSQTQTWTLLRHRFSWTRLSMSGALAYRPDASQAALMFQIKQGLMTPARCATGYQRSTDHVILTYNLIEEGDVFTTKLRKVGGSVMLAIPPAVLDMLQLRAGAAVGLSVDAGHLVVDPQVRPRYTLDELLAQCDPSADVTVEDQVWLDSEPVGGELL